MKKYRIKETGVVVEMPTGLHCYYIGANGFKLSDLKDLGLTVEELVPEKKKALAYVTKDGLLRFIVNDSLEQRYTDANELWTRQECFDIEGRDL